MIDEVRADLLGCGADLDGVGDKASRVHSGHGGEVFEQQRNLHPHEGKGSKVRQVRGMDPYVRFSPPGLICWWPSKGPILVPRSRNARGLRTPYVLVDPPCAHRKGLTCASQNRFTLRERGTIISPLVDSGECWLYPGQYVKHSHLRFLMNDTWDFLWGYHFFCC